MKKKTNKQKASQSALTEHEHVSDVCTCRYQEINEYKMLNKTRNPSLVNRFVKKNHTIPYCDKLVASLHTAWDLARDRSLWLFLILTRHGKL